MPESDRTRWDRKYAASEGPAGSQPDPFLVRHCGLLRGGRALDVACGLGGNALYLAAWGYRVEAIDVSAVALDKARAEAVRRGLRIDFLQADLARWPVPAERYDVAAMFFYLNRELLPALAAGLRPGGLLFLAGHNRAYLAHKPDFNPTYLWAPGEMVERVQDAGLRVVSTGEGAEEGRYVSRILARRPLRPCQVRG